MVSSMNNRGTSPRAPKFLMVKYYGVLKGYCAVKKVRKSWEENMRPYYHFTSLEAFRKINDTGKLRLSSCSCAKNVAVEIMALYSAVKNIIDNDTDLKEQLLTGYGCSQVKGLIDRIIEQREQSYIACFSALNEENEESEILEKSYLWRFYADHEKGVVIKFNYDYFPYENHGTKAEYTGYEGIQRLTEERIGRVIYGERELKKCLGGPKDQHLFLTDIYKPKYCELENEIRFTIFLKNIKDLYKLDNISVTDHSNSERPEYLYYKLASQSGDSTSAGIKKVFCKSKETYEKLCDIFDNRRVALIV